MTTAQRHLFFMRAAIREAAAGVHHRHGGPFGAIIVKNGKVIARAHNQVVKTNDPTAHAEVNAIRAATKKLKSFSLAGCILYTTCEPCHLCLAAALWARVDAIYYGCTRKDAAAIGFDDARFHQSFIVKPSLRRKLRLIGRRECLRVFAAWQANKKKVIY
jgi:guanine deaminase